MSTLTFSKADQWIKQYYEARIKENIEFDKDGTQQSMELESKSKLSQGLKDKKGQGKMEVEVSVKDVNSKNIFSTLNRRDNIDFLAIKAQNAMKRYDFYEAYNVCLK